MLVATLNLLKKGCISGIRTRTRAFPCSRLLQSSLFSSNPNPNPNPASDSQHIHNPISRFDFGGLEPFSPAYGDGPVYHPLSSHSPPKPPVDSYPFADADLYFSSHLAENPSAADDDPFSSPFPLDSDPFASAAPHSPRARNPLLADPIIQKALYPNFSFNLAEDPSPPSIIEEEETPFYQEFPYPNVAVRQVTTLYNSWIHYNSPTDPFVNYMFKCFSVSYTPSNPSPFGLAFEDYERGLDYFFNLPPPHEDYPPLCHELLLFWLLTNHAIHLLVPCLKQLCPLPNDSDDALLYSELCPFLKTGILGDVSGPSKVAGPDVVSMVRALRSLLKSGRIADAFDFLEEALSMYDDYARFKGLKKEISYEDSYEFKLYHAMIDGLCRMKRTGDAFELYKEMRQAFLFPCRDCYKMLVSLLSAEGRYEEASLLSKRRI